jgi:hypothetical protein
MTDETPDWSRVDSFMAARRRAMLLHASWRPMLAGAAGAGAMILCAFAGAYLAGPTLKSKVYEIPVLDVTHQPVVVPEVTMKPVTVPDITVTTHPLDIPVPRVVPAPSDASAAPAPPQSPEAFTASPEYRSAELSATIAGSDGGNGFRFEDGRSFSPAHLVNGRIEEAKDVFDDISGLIGAPAYCAPLAGGLYACRAWRKGVGVVEIPIRARPATGGKPTRAPPAVVGGPKAIEAKQEQRQ